MQGLRITFSSSKLYENKGGIYMIQNIVNGKYYIGSTKNFTQRWLEHSKSLRIGKSSSIILQRAYNKYKHYNFRFVPILVMDDTSTASLLQTEQVYLTNEKPAYNAMPNATTVGRISSKETIEKQRASLIKNFSLLPDDVKRGNMKGIEVTNVLTGEIDCLRSYLKLKTKYGISYCCARRMVKGITPRSKKYRHLTLKEF